MMNKKYIYEELKEHDFGWGNWYWYLGSERINEEYEELTLINVLNVLGERGWKLVSTINEHSHILMKEVV